MAGVVGIIVLGGAGVGTWLATRSSAAAAPSTLVSVTQGPVRQIVTTSGTIAPAHEADLSFQVAGTVTAVEARVGAVVTAGSSLATVDPTDLAAAVDAAQAAVDAASQQLAVQQSADAPAVQRAAATASLAAAQGKLTDAQRSLGEATLTSPIAGTVAAVNLSPGDRVNGSSGSGASNGSSTASASGSGRATTTGATSAVANAASGSTSVQIVVISTNAWVIDASVGSADLTRVKSGLQGEITPTGTTTKVFGLVTSVGIVASSSAGGAATFPVTIAVTGDPGGLYAGGTADVSIIVKQIANVLSVPTAALHSVGGKTVVYQMINGHQVDTDVTIGTVYGPTTEILHGLVAGDQVVMPALRGGGAFGGQTGVRRRGTGVGGSGGFGGGGFGGGAGLGGGTGFGGGAG